MKRLTTDQPSGNVETFLNLFYAKDGEVWVRGGGPEPLYQDVRLHDFIRETIRNTVDEERDYVADFSDEELGEVMCGWIEDGNTSIEGLIGTLYTAAWAFAEIRARLEAYEDTGLEPEEIEKAMSDCAEVVVRNQFAIKDLNELGGIDHIRELVQAEKDGRLVQYVPGNIVYDRFGMEWTVKSAEIHRIDGQLRFLYRCGHPGTDDYRALYSDEILIREEAEAALKGGGDDGQI